MEGVEVSEMTVEEEEVEVDEKRRAAVGDDDGDDEGAIDGIEGAIDHLAAKLPTFGDAKALVRSRARERADAAVARAPAEARGDITLSVPLCQTEDGRDSERRE